ncbi:NAD-glutamate dehydrogenase [Novosphingobium ginsenosidimutans]|uniref:NAD-glutamate dehydrogenase n=1 Tax=Novosphingobium ginsenosidimutans TaxID=1176536 RepID=A0A5B8S0K3_9SPHN|nr:NAD-glutamate dehydrogenase [Novosphingobium ginsenosidimutans]QEA15099.1 NAD-glutamate dehydrogenase [Novosphingobium ginsenosidimutans]
MLIRPELMALRADDTPQRLIQRRLVDQSNAWRQTGQGAQVEAELLRLASGAALADLPLLAALFTAGDPAAAGLVGGVAAWLLTELAKAPLGQVPLRHQYDRTLATLVLARSHGASLAIQAIDGAGLALKPPAQSVSFAANENWEHMLAGSALIERVQITGRTQAGVAMRREQLTFAAGEVTQRSGREVAQIYRQVSGIAVLLRLQRSDGSGAASCEYALEDGRLLHQAAGTPRDSRLELTASLLGRMARRDAAPLLAAMAEEAGSPHLRWQALRECLGLDSAIGFAALSAIARRSEDPLAVPAGALRAQLLEAYPQLAEVSACPA